MRHLRRAGPALMLVVFSAPLAAQQASALRVGVTGPVQSYQGLHRERPDTFPPHPKRTYWKEGALIAGIPAAIGGYLFISGMEGSRLKGLGGGLYAGAIMGALGAFTGWFFAKPERPIAVRCSPFSVYANLAVASPPAASMKAAKRRPTEGAPMSNISGCH